MEGHDGNVILKIDRDFDVDINDFMGAVISERLLAFEYPNMSLELWRVLVGTIERGNAFLTRQCFENDPDGVIPQIAYRCHEPIRIFAGFLLPWNKIIPIVGSRLKAGKQINNIWWINHAGPLPSIDFIMVLYDTFLCK